MSLVTTLYKDHKGVFDEKLFKLSIRRVSEPSPPEIVTSRRNCSKFTRGREALSELSCGRMLHHLTHPHLSARSSAAWARST